MMVSLPSAFKAKTAPPTRRGLRTSTLRHLAAIGLPLIALTGLVVAASDLRLGSLAITALCGLAAALLVLTHLPRALPGDRFGRANGVTLGRGALICLLAGTLAGGQPSETLAWGLCVLAALALALDGLDGWLARRYDEVSDFGARFDMETDALFLLVLSLLVLVWDKAGAWILLAGLWRYGYVAAGLIWPALTRPLPESRRRKLAFVLQAALLVLCLAPPLTPPISTLLAASGLAILSLSFLIDLAYQLRHTTNGGSAP